MWQLYYNNFIRITVYKSETYCYSADSNTIGSCNLSSRNGDDISTVRKHLSGKRVLGSETFYKAYFYSLMTLNLYCKLQIAIPFSYFRKTNLTEMTQCV